MEHFKLLSTLKDYADGQNWHFLSGNNFNQNYEASQNEYNAGQLVLAVDFDAVPVFSAAGAVSEIRYVGVMALGQKVEEDELTRSNLDETFWQKYTLRLEALMTSLSVVLVTIACNNELEIQDVRFRMELNKFDTNIDFVAANVTLIQ